jgi:hypothetical protein
MWEAEETVVVTPTKVGGSGHQKERAEEDHEHQIYHPGTGDRELLDEKMKMGRRQE